ncbi:MAG: alpha-glucan family phosphorylase [Thermodesulfobacteriota bacterium]
MTIPTADITPNNLLAENRFGTFIGVSQQALDMVFDRLRDPAGNSVVYITMEIGADRDVFHPIKSWLMQQKTTPGPDQATGGFVASFLNGPEKIPIYGGGLGILAGDTLKSFADCRIPVAAVSLLYRRGYFSQLVDMNIGQVAWSREWSPEETPGLYLLRDPRDQASPLAIEVPFFDRDGARISAHARLWMKMEVNSQLDFFVPEILLDYDLPATPAWIREASHHLYDSSSETTKAIQRRLLGAGVQPAMTALGFTARTLHLNEQHGVVAVLALIDDLLRQKLGGQYQEKATDQDIMDAAAIAAERIVYTIHTPVKAGHDRFSRTIYQEMGSRFFTRLLDLLAYDDDNPAVYNFTAFAMRMNRATNSVSRLHKEVTRKQFPQYAGKITAVTNGVHHLTWISDAKAAAYDTAPELFGWRRDPSAFTNAATLLADASFRACFEQAGAQDTAHLIGYVNRMLLQHRNQRLETWIDPPNYLSYLSEKEGRLDPAAFTFGFARRFSTYKRADLIFEDLDRLAGLLIANQWPVNFVFAGKAHPADEPGKGLIKNILDLQDELYHKSNGLARLVFIPGYDMAIAKMMVAGCHAWLNSPKRPLEASGTSGMKAAMNGVPNVSIMDGWWVEGYHEGQTGWKFGYEAPVAEEQFSEHPSALLYAEDSASFYEVLPDILGTFYDPERRPRYLDKCIMNLALNCPVFNTHRMIAEYLLRYGLDLPEHQARQMQKFRQLYCSDPEACF